MLLLSLLLSVSAHATAPSPQEALALFRGDASVQKALRAAEAEGYVLDGEAGAALHSLGFGDEGYCSEFVASQPLAKGASPSDKATRLVAARVRLCWPDRAVELIDEGALRDSLRKTK